MEIQPKPFSRRFSQIVADQNHEPRTHGKPRQVAKIERQLGPKPKSYFLPGHTPRDVAAKVETSRAVEVNYKTRRH